MAVFTAHISAQVTSTVKQGLAAILDQDKAISPGTSEGDVIRLAIELGTPALHELTPEQRVVSYAYLRRGLALPQGTSLLRPA